MFNFLGGSGGYRDPDAIMAEAYGVSPEVIAMKRLENIGTLGAAVLGASRGGDSSKIAETALAQTDMSSSLKDMGTLKLNGLRIKNEERELSMKEAAAKRQAEALGEIARLIGGGGGDGSSLSMVTPVGGPQYTPGSYPPGMITPNGGVGAGPAPIPGPGMAPAGGGSPALTAAERSYLGALAKLDPKAAMEKYYDITTRDRWNVISQDNMGNQVLENQKGDRKVVTAQSREQMLEAEQGKSDIQGNREAGLKVIQSGLDKEREEAKRAGEESQKQREQARGLTIDGMKAAAADAKASADILQKVDRMQNLLDLGVYNGSPANVTLGQAQALLSKAGLWKSEYFEDKNARTAALQSLGTGLAVDMVKNLKPVSNTEIEMALRAAGGDPSKLTDKAMRLILNEVYKQNAEKIDSYGKRREASAELFGKGPENRQLYDMAFPEVTRGARYHGISRPPNGKSYRIYVDDNGKFVRSEDNDG